jgi:hypothetical protein
VAHGGRGASELLYDPKWVLSEQGRPLSLSLIEVTPLDSTGVARILRGAVSPLALGIDDAEDFRISIAGAQEKTGLTLHDQRWCQPHGATPTTHIFKLPLGLVGGGQMDLPGDRCGGARALIQFAVLPLACIEAALGPPAHGAHGLTLPG